MFWEKYKNLFSINYSSIIIIVISISALIIYYTISMTSHSSKEDDIVKIYFADNISNAHAEVIQKFNEIHRGEIEVIPINLPFSKFSTNERKELLTRALRSKSERLDVFAVDLIWIPRFTKWCEPLDKYMPDVEADGYLKYALESCFIEGELVALPIYIDISMMYYREDFLKTLPDFEEVSEKLRSSITWKDFIKLSGKLKGLKNPFYIFPADDYEGLICSYFELILNQDPNFFKNPDYDISGPIGKKALQLLVDLVNKFNMTPQLVTQLKEDNCYDYFLKHDGIFMRGWPSFEKNYIYRINSNPDYRHIRKAALPHFEGSGSGSVFGGWNLMMARFTKHKKEVLEFIKYTSSYEAQEIMLDKGAFLPVLSKFYSDSAYLKKYPDFEYLKKLIDKGIHRPFLKDYTRVSDIISYYVNKAIKSEMTVDQALKEANYKIRNQKVIIK